MAFPVFSPVRGPTYPASESRTPNIKRSNMGDGYVQRVKQGINHDKIVLDYEWANLSTAEMATIWGFFVDRAGYEAFEYTPRGYVDALIFTAPVYSRSEVAPGTWRVSATLEQEFDPE